MKDSHQKDLLALVRTKLALERTFLAYFRTFLVLLSSGLVIIKIEFLKEAKTLGIALIVIASLMLLIGLGRYIYMRAKIQEYHNKN